MVAIAMVIWSRIYRHLYSPGLVEKPPKPAHLFSFFSDLILTKPKQFGDCPTITTIAFYGNNLFFSAVEQSDYVIKMTFYFYFHFSFQQKQIRKN